MPVRPVCPYCGATLSAGARYCDRCGTPLQPEASRRRRGTGGGRSVALWVVVVVLFGIFLAGTLGGYRFTAGQWPGLQAVQAAGANWPLGSTKPAPVPIESAEAIAGYLRAVVAIDAKDQAGSGFIIDGRGHVLTAYHVVAGTTCVTVTDDNGRQHQGTVLNYDAALDVALLHVAGLETWKESLAMATENPPAAIGDDAYVIGHPRGVGSNIPMSAKVTKLDADQAAEGRYHRGLIALGDVTVRKGTSGGPLVSKTTGRVIGVMLLSGDPTPVAWARPVADILEKVRQWAVMKPAQSCEIAAATRTIPLTLVTITPRTGTYDLEGEELADGADMALRYMASFLRQAGYEVTLKREDDGGAPAGAREKAELVAQDPKVIGVVGSLEDTTTRAIAEALAPSNLPMVAPIAGAEELTAQGWPHFNRVVARNLRQNPVLANFAKDMLKVSNVYVLEDGSADAALQMGSFKAGAAVIGMPIAGTMQVAATTDTTEIKRRLAEAKAEAVYYAGRSETALRLIRGLRAQDVQLPFLGNQAAFAPAQFQPFTGAGAHGIYFTRLTAEPVDQFRRAYDSVFGKPTRGYAAYGYDAAYVILDALVRYGDIHPAQAPSHAELAQLIRGTRGHAGWSAPISFESNGDNQTAWVHIYEWNKGRPEYKGNL